ncbi:universal stress protein [Haloarcula nitratireducens]|uniref:Universal stress protein n=1 Tax=Haloarcula nitratireducens TaxID=2487749 RepID=A0AAW4PAS6_9EURY|nr:universal stress protein [Halomicroarcula nitratireducens]MBX0295006.1 universal stress protein [Halomicroarcula nitratireducens]
MTLLVPYDGSDLSEAALERATEFAGYTDENVLVLAVVPDEPDYALERGWLSADDPFDPETIADRLRDRVAEVAPDAEFRYEVPEAVSEMASVTTDVVRTIRSVANEVEASIVFIGSENAGRVSSPVSSVGAPVSEDPQYDVHIVRHA